MGTLQTASRHRHKGDPQIDPDHRVMNFFDWCAVNNFSASTGRRIIGRGEVAVTRLSPRRIGITVGANRAYQASRTRGEV